MSDKSEEQAPPTAPSAGAPERAAKPSTRNSQVHEIIFTTYPKLLFVWPLILLGFVFYPIGWPAAPKSAVVTTAPAAEPAMPAEPDAAPVAPKSSRLAILGWIYIWVMLLVLLTLGVDVDRNQAIFWVVLFGLVWVLGLWLRDTRQFTLFGNIYRWFSALNVQYDRGFGLALSLILLVPYLLMLFWARLNDRWRITHNEFEHYAFGKMDDSLGRGAKTIRTSFPDVLELLLGLAGTLIVFNANGTRELRRIPHVMFLPFVRKRLNKILERTAITAAEMEEEEDDDEA